MTGVAVAVRPTVFKREDVLTPEMLRAAYEVIDKNHPAVKAATARARNGKIEGTALMALEAGDQSAGSILRGIELLMKGDLNPAANQFGVALRNPADAPIASFFLGACYAAAGRDKEAVAAWERARAAKLQLPALQLVIADAWLRLGQPADALEPLRQALERQPQDDDIRRNLAVAQSHLGLHELAYPTIVPYPRTESQGRRRAVDCPACALSDPYRREDHWLGRGGQGQSRHLRARVRRREGTAAAAGGEVGGIPESISVGQRVDQESGVVGVSS